MSMLSEGTRIDSAWLAHEMEVVRRDLERARNRVARTIVTHPELRVVLVGVRAGGGIHEHTARGPLTIHVLTGCLELEAAGRTTTLGAGMLTALEGGVPHTISSSEGGVFLLTLLHKEPELLPD